MPQSRKETRNTDRPNILVLCMDQWQTHMELPEGVELPALERLESQGVTFDRAYCTVPVCTPSRATMWTGMHAKHTGVWDNTNFAWIDELSQDIPTIGHMLRQHGYYTAFKGKWHLSLVPPGEDALERYGFSDYQQWGEMFGAPLEGHMVDGTAAFETVDWLESKGTQLDQPWLLVSSLVNPHDIMFYQSDPIEKPHDNGSIAGIQTTAQKLDFFEKQWDVTLPDNFADDYELQPPAVHHFKEFIDLNYGNVPDHRTDLWLQRRNYLINCMRRVDGEFLRILETLDRLDLWENTVVLFVSDHGEMNGAHRLAQKGAIHFDEATIVNLTACVPGGPQGKRTNAVASLLDLVPTMLEFAGVSEDEVRQHFPALKGRNLKPAILAPDEPGPRGSVDDPGDGALLCWDSLHSIDNDWAISGALSELSDMTLKPPTVQVDKAAEMRGAGAKYGSPDFSKRTFYRTVVDGQYKLVRWFSPLDYGNPSTVEELYARSDVTLHDLVNDPGELQNIGHPDHPDYKPELVEHMLAKLNALVEQEIGDDQVPFDLDMFGTREVTYRVATTGDA